MDGDTGVSTARPHLPVLREQRGVIAVASARVPGPRRPITLNERGAFEAADVDTARAHPARIEDYLLGGHDNYEVDRDLAQQILAAVPHAPAMIRARRDFVARAVQQLVKAGARQVLDIGAGLDPVSVDAARCSGGPARVVLVDNDPSTVVNLQGRWERDERLLRAIALYGELCWPETFLRVDRVLDVLDPAAPIVVVLGAVLEHVLDTRAAKAALDRVMGAMPAGSHLVITHATGDQSPRPAAHWAQFYQQAASPLALRGREQVASFLDGMVIAEPGLVRLDASGDDATAPTWTYAAVARKP